ncbi:MAG: hypothetical protein WDW36_006971 [Sanguina aurantia]
MQYRNPWGLIRVGRLLEDLDSLAGNIAFEHCLPAAQLPLLVTASVDEIELLHPISIERNITMSGQVVYTGSSSLDIQMQLVQEQYEGVPSLTAIFSFVHLDPVTKRPAPVAQLLPRTAAEQALFATRQALSERRRLARKAGAGLDACQPSQEAWAWMAPLLAQARRIHELPAVAENADSGIAMHLTSLQNAFVCQPQQQNTRGRIFGGYLMRRAYELGFATAYCFAGSRPIFVRVEQVTFTKPVSVGDLLRLRSWVVHTVQPDAQLFVDVTASVTQPELGDSSVSNTFSFVFEVQAKPAEARTPAVIIYLHIKLLQGGVSLSQLASHSIAVPGVQQSWLPGHLLDLSDPQWREFRGSLGTLAAALTAFAACSRLVQRFAPKWRVCFSVWYSLIFLGALHGTSCVHVLVLCCSNYLLSRAVAGSRLGLPLIWSANLGTLCIVRSLDGVPFSMLSTEYGGMLDSLRGPLRWQITYNLLVLRMVSYACDLHWARIAAAKSTPHTSDPPTQGPSSPRPHPLHPDLGSPSAGTSSGALDQVPAGGSSGGDVKRTPAQAAAQLSSRVKTPLSLERYNAGHYVAYLLYPPLYVAGPILTFNNFSSQLLQPSASAGGRKVLLYALRWLACATLLEAFTHCLHANAVAKHRVLEWMQKRFDYDQGSTIGGGMAVQPMHYAVVGYWVLLFTWLKFLVIWRFFRLAALLEGMDPPENMTRCVCNNYEIEGFWRHWHASFNQWLVRYLYIPLGGSSWRLLNAWVIFSFVAMWHELDWALLGWGWLMAAAMAPEAAAKWLAKGDLHRRRYASSWGYRQLCALAAAANISVLMIANLIGFVVGLDGIQPLLAKVVGDPWFFAAVVLAFFSAAHVMFRLRGGQPRPRHAPPATIKDRNS